VEKHYKKQAKPTHKDIGNEHGTVVEAGFRHVRLLAVWALFGHLKRCSEGESGGREQIALLAAWAFEADNIIKLRVFAIFTHD
jgi:hypothetical protein